MDKNDYIRIRFIKFTKSNNNKDEIVEKVTTIFEK